jgi:FkbH-like protein
MTLNEALEIVNQCRKSAPQRSLFLVCGFEPLHLLTFLQAHAARRFSGNHVGILTGIYGDFPGNLERAGTSAATAAAVVLEWEVLDPRLGLRSSGGWSNKVQADIVRTCEQRLKAIAICLAGLAARMPVALAGPTLPPPPLGHTSRRQASLLELALQHQVAGFLQQVSHMPGVRVLNPVWLETASPLPTRLDAKMELLSGFPYSRTHADALAAALVDVLYPLAPKKGLIVDLDDTLWRGIVGEVGIDGISWCQERRTQVHAWLQQMLDQLASHGVLLGVSSKNDPKVARQALERADLLARGDLFYPVIANWGPKSQAVREILRAWNIAAESVVFLDDNPMELSEVEAAHPGITCLRFTPDDPAAVWQTLAALRDLFGKPAVLAEDELRSASIRSVEAFREGEALAGAAFLHTLSGRVSIAYGSNLSDQRPLELINKTNQFNLNGVRIMEGEWHSRLRAPGCIAATVSYEDKFGPLGKIAALLGENHDRRIVITAWVMSCRAFSRKIEHHTLDSLFRVACAEEILFAFRPTERNGPVQQFLKEIGAAPCSSGYLRLARDVFIEQRHELPHDITESEI